MIADHIINPEFYFAFAISLPENKKGLRKIAIILIYLPRFKWLWHSIYKSYIQHSPLFINEFCDMRKNGIPIPCNEICDLFPSTCGSS